MSRESITNLPKIMRALADEALPSVASSAQIFANAPATTKQIWLTIRTAGITMTLDGTAATTTNGHDFAVNSTSSPYVFDFDQTAALLVRAIATTGTPAGHITYLG